MITAGEESAFVQAFKVEMKAAQHAALVELYEWANRKGYGADPDLHERAETWTAKIEAVPGLAMEVLLATADDK